LTYPDGTFAQLTYDRLDLVAYLDRAGRQTSLARDSMRQITTMTDPLGRVTHFEWCRCGAPKSVIDPMGRKTSWLTDVQGRRIAKQFVDGSQVQYLYENMSSRLQELIDENQQDTIYTYNPDDTVNAIVYENTAVPTPNVSFSYDPNYQRVVSMTDGIGVTIYNYIPITSPPVLGAGRLGSVDGPLSNETATYAYDELGRAVQTSVDGVLAARGFDVLGRIISVSNALGSFAFSYDGASGRLLSGIEPNGQTASAAYGSNIQDFTLQQLNYAVGATPVSQFNYARDIPRMQITNWSQQAGAQSPSVFAFGYDAVNQLLSSAVTNAGVQVGAFAYSYDLSGDRLTEQISGATATANYNALNQLSTIANAAFISGTNQWDGQNRLADVNAGNLQTVFGYDGANRLAYIQQLENGSQVSFRRFVWCNGSICEERDATGTVITKRYFPQGVMLQTSSNLGPYYYTRDHLGSIRELTDASGNVRARYSYDPFGRQTKVSGDVDADFGFAGMFWSTEANLSLTQFRAYDPQLGRWLSRDPLRHAEVKEGPNLYAYVRNNPVNLIDPLGKVPWSSGYAPYNPGSLPGPVPAAPPAVPPPPPPPPVPDVPIAPSTPGPPIYQAPVAPLGSGVVAAGPGFFSQEICNAGQLFGPPGVAVALALVAGLGAGYEINQEFDVSERASNLGVEVYHETGSRFLGGVVTLEEATNPLFWILDD
jgi:RHS repeat-associated protein